MKRIISWALFMALIVTVISGCKKKDVVTDPPADSPNVEGLIKLSEGYAVGAATRVEVWGARNYFAGYNKLTIALYDSVNSTQIVTNAQIQFNPLMEMISHTHSAPFENPPSTPDGNVFRGAVVFQMASVTPGDWKLNINVTNNNNGRSGQATFAITVENPASALVKVMTTYSPDSNTIIIALLKPLSPIVGINDIEFTVHRKVSPMEFPADDSYTLEIDPQMPSMGHGSPNNVNPSCCGIGHYTGKVNFTMTGWWRVYVDVKKGGNLVLPDAYFDITF